MHRKYCLIATSYLLEMKSTLIALYLKYNFILITSYIIPKYVPKICTVHNSIYFLLIEQSMQHALKITSSRWCQSTPQVG